MARGREYIDGNTVRKLNTYVVPERRYEKEEKLSPKTRKKIDKVQSFDLKYTLALVVAIGFTFAACVSMISVQAEINAQKKEIAALESQYQNLSNDNDAASARVNSDVDLNEIKKIAMEELGMVYPDRGQVVTYDSASEQYVKQYKDVPDVDE